MSSDLPPKPLAQAFTAVALAGTTAVLARRSLLAVRFALDSDSGVAVAAGMAFTGVGVTLAAVALAAALLTAGARWARRGEGPLRFVTVAVFTWVHVTGRWPHSTFLLPDLSAPRGLAVTIAALALAAAAGALAARPPRLSRTAPLTFVAAGTLLLGGLAGQPAAQGRGPNVILISLDTVRADRLGAYGYGRETSPTLDRFAEQATRFENAFTVSGWTLTAHMSMLTGLTPGLHGVEESRALPGAIPTLSELLRDSGYRTLGVADDCPWVSPRYGFRRGFDVYRRTPAPAPAKIAESLRLLDATAEGPFFLFCHLFDAHSDEGLLPYEAHPDDLEEFGALQGARSFTGVRGLGGSELLKAHHDGEVSLGAETMAWISDLYDAGLRTLDRDLARLFEGLRDRGLLEKSVIIVTADHGEELFETGACLHTGTSDRVFRVPLLIRWPDRAPSVDDRLVSLVDLAPTILAAAGAPRPELPGLDLRASATADRLLVRTDRPDGPWWVRGPGWSAVRNSNAWQVIDPITDAALGKPSLEQQRLLDREASTFAQQRANLPAAKASAPLDEQERAKIRALGYGGD